MPGLFPTTVVGSYPQPGWLIDRSVLTGGNVPRVSARGFWRVDPDMLEEAQDDATRLAIRDMERAGIDIISDGEIRRDSYSNHFLLSLEGIDESDPAIIRRETGQISRLPRVVGPIKWRTPVEVASARFLQRNTDRRIKVTLPGPFTMSQLTHDQYYKDPEALASAFADAVNAEARLLQAEGVDVIQLDEPYLRNAPDEASAFGVRVIDRALAELTVTTAIHLCFGYGFLAREGKPKHYTFLGQLADCRAQQISIEAAQPGIDLGALTELAPKTILLGLLALDPNAPVETGEQVAARIRAALAHVPPERLIPAPDCGMKYLDRATAFTKLKALSDGAAMVRAELTGSA
ncbi:5-methyltetrahydropteroyltriglutamate--homocysteine methyltransferase [Sphingomonas crusticola]|uniref:5-methyltetrahydropteroyltriglutamate-- homocysteine methyltransferase n=1 Tax=Sphingomonas crusticola TaxID=1697973 RepID=UPI000E260836|nr:5-methyltetrahydropteroyltriglutamate--homocysteine methyltransferase [Sphingomonas crusticola]